MNRNLKMKVPFLMSLLLLMALAVQAQILIPIPIIPAWTALIQNPEATDSGVTTSVPAPTRYSITAKTLLAIIARDEFQEHNYPSNSFPSGSRLVLMADPGSFAGSYYVVENKSGQILVTNLSDLMSLQNLGDFTVHSYVEDDATGLNNPMMNDYIETFSFDDTGVGGTMKFNLSRLVEATSRDKASSNGSHTETVTLKAGAGNGTGNFGGNNAVVYSSPQTETGRGTFPMPP